MAAESAEEREAGIRQMREREWLPSLLKREKPGYVETREHTLSACECTIECSREYHRVHYWGLTRAGSRSRE